MKYLVRSIALLTIIISNNLLAGVPVPTCFAGKQELKIDNETVLNWKSNTRNQYRNRAYVRGHLLYIYPDQNGHYHYQVQIGANNKDTIEIIYNKGFGTIPKNILGATFLACGDYITSNAPTEKYPASPDGAIIHWVHRSQNTSKHDSGFVVINNITYGHAVK